MGYHKIISDTFIKGKHAKAGQILEIDDKTSDGAETKALLESANRIVPATEEEVASAMKQSQSRSGVSTVGGDAGGEEDGGAGPKGKGKGK